MLSRIETQRANVFLADARVLDIRAGSLSSPTGVVVNKGVIADISAQSPPPDCDIIECDGMTLMPGIIDCHCHILSPFVAEQGIPGPWALRQIYRNFESTLAAGIVCVRDMLSPINIMNHYRGAIASGAAGPRIMASGPILSRKGGYPEFLTPLPAPVAFFTGQPRINISSAEQAAAVVGSLKSHGADHIKVAYTRIDLNLKRSLPVMSLDLLDAVCVVAHENGLRVAAHHFYAEELLELIDTKVDSLEHLPFDRDLTDHEVELVRRSGKSVVPTLAMSNNTGLYDRKKKFLASEYAAAMFEPRVLENLKKYAELWLDYSNPENMKSFGSSRGKPVYHETAMRNTARFAAAGVNLCAGTDMGAVVCFPGETIDEIMLLHQAGLSKADALRAATLRAAEMIGIETKIGSVEPGMEADAILVDGNPLEDLSALKRVKIVGRGGRWHRTTHPRQPDFGLL